MAVADIANIPADWTSLQVWSFAHMAHHRDLISHVLASKNVALTLYPLDPINPGDLGSFAYQHQLMHTDINNILGIVGNDLLDIDWQNDAARAEWIWLNMQEHLQYAQKTGVG